MMEGSLRMEKEEGVVLLARLSREVWLSLECSNQPMNQFFNQSTNSQNFLGTIFRVADPDPVGSGVFAWIRIRIWFSNFSESGSGFSPRLPEQKRVQKGL